MKTTFFRSWWLNFGLLAGLVMGPVFWFSGTARADALDPFLGEITCGGWNFCPINWAPCDGHLLSIAQNQALFALLGTTYGGDGKTTFAVPNIRGRTMIHQGQGNGLSNRTIGTTGGAESVTLTPQQLPPHNHYFSANSGPGTSASPTNSVPGSAPASSPIYATAQPNTALSDAAVGAAGGSTPHNNLQPYLTVQCCIATAGIFPSQY